MRKFYKAAAMCIFCSDLSETGLVSSGGAREEPLAGNDLVPLPNDWFRPAILVSISASEPQQSQLIKVAARTPCASRPPHPPPVQTENVKDEKPRQGGNGSCIFMASCAKRLLWFLQEEGGWGGQDTQDIISGCRK